MTSQIKRLQKKNIWKHVEQLSQCQISWRFPLPETWRRPFCDWGCTICSSIFESGEHASTLPSVPLSFYSRLSKSSAYCLFQLQFIHFNFVSSLADRIHGSYRTAQSKVRQGRGLRCGHKVCKRKVLQWRARRIIFPTGIPPDLWFFENVCLELATQLSLCCKFISCELTLEICRPDPCSLRENKFIGLTCWAGVSETCAFTLQSLFLQVLLVSKEVGCRLDRTFQGSAANVWRHGLKTISISLQWGAIWGAILCWEAKIYGHRLDIDVRIL